MARSIIPVERLGSPSATAFETALNAALAGVLSSFIGALNISITDRLPAYTRQFKAIIDTKSGGTVITHPYKVKVFEADTDVTAKAAAEAFIALQPAWWYAPVDYRYSDLLPNVPNRALIFLVYNEDATDGAANWQPGYVNAGGTPVTLSTYNVKAYGATGDGVTDDIVAIQACVDAAIAGQGKVVFPSGTYRITSRITLGDYPAATGTEWVPPIEGLGKVTINQSTAAAWTFWLDARVGTGSGIDMYQFYMSNLTIFAKYGISIGAAESDPAFGGDGSGQCYFLGPKLVNIKVYGTYGAGVDPNYASFSVVPTLLELQGYGYGIRLSKVFNCSISGGWLVGCGIALGLFGTDISSASGDTRLQSNARHVHNKGIVNTGTFGSQFKLDHCDMLNNFRMYGVYNDRTQFFEAAFCFLENAGFPNVFLREEGTIGSSWLDNRFNSLENIACKWCSLNPAYGLQFVHNQWATNGLIIPSEVLYDYWTVSFPVTAEFIDNNPNMPIPNAPAVRWSGLSPYIFNYQNTQGVNGAIAASFPWELDGTRWVIKDDAATTLVVLMTIPQLPGPYFRLRITARVLAAAVTPAGGIDLKWRYTEDGVDTTIYNSGLAFTDKTNYTTRDFVFATPAKGTKAGSGRFTITLTNDTLHVASVEILEYVEPAGIRSTPDPALPYQGKNALLASIVGTALSQTPPSDSRNLMSWGPDGGSYVELWNDVLAALTATIFIRIPIYGDATKYTGYAGANGPGMYYNSGDQASLFFGSVAGTIYEGVFNLDPTRNAGAVFTSYRRMLANGRFISGLITDPDDGGSKEQVYGNLAIYDGSLRLGSIGSGIVIKTGANSRLGTATLVAGTVTVANTSVTANTQVFPSRRVAGGTVGELEWSVNPGVGFTISSLSALDTSEVVWMLVELLP